MNLNFSQTTGKITKDDGALVAAGWAGNGQGKNKPSMQAVRCVGPLPQGVYKVGPWHTHERLGPLAAKLDQIEGVTYGRDDFYVHGASSKNFGQESKGCIVVPRPGREAIIRCDPDTFTVTE